METRLRTYVEEMFEDAPQTQRLYELKEEILQNVIEKYRDLIAQGKSEEAAYGMAIATIGDISSLIRQLEDEQNPQTIREQKRSAALTAIAIMLYILSVIPVLILEHAGNLGIILMFIMVAVATGLLIYNHMTKPRYQRQDDTVVEEFREWKSEKAGQKAVLRSVNSAIWSIAVVLYFVVSFTTMAWHVTWVIFLIATAVTSIVSAIFQFKENR